MTVEKGSVQTAKSFRPTELLQQQTFKALIQLHLSSSLSIPLCLWSVVVPIRLVLFGSVPVSGYGAVSSTCPAAALLMLPQLELLTLVFTLPEPWSLEDLLHKLLKGTLDAIFGLCTGLCTEESTKERALPRLMRLKKNLVQHKKREEKTLHQLLNTEQSKTSVFL